MGQGRKEGKKEGGLSTGTVLIEESEDKDHYISLYKRCSVYTVEIIGIAKTIQKFEEEKSIGYIIIFSDSKSAIQGIAMI